MVHGELFFMIMGTSEEDGEINRQKNKISKVCMHV